ncbi:MAG: radical SAM protein [Elusimicrobiota bacterium]|jgi:putative pyruvate formate lyase activating enzyme|nr:radical SAM protein [Elusimicrobiota bacterium]
MNTQQNINKLFSMMDSCNLCPRACGVNRNKSVKGFCKTADEIFIASHTVHNGEEPPISGMRGSGTIFFSNCSLNCVFCQNYPISQFGNGRKISVNDLADIMLELQDKGVHNINLVTPTHYSAHIAKAIYIAKQKGLKIPTLYNSSGYESVEALRLLEGLIDIYMPDIKYGDDETAFRYSNVKNYVKTNQAALKEMKRQAGGLSFDSDGTAKKGLLIRHLVLPNEIENSKSCLDFIAKELSKDTYISIMSQYHKAYKSDDLKMPQKLDGGQYRQVLDYMDSLGLENGWRQEE